MFADLHIHTNYSDGRLSVADTINIAKERNVELLSITDHDSIAGINDAINISRARGITCISGIELSCRNENINVAFPEDLSIHILAYNINYMDKNLQEYISQFHFRRKKILLELIEELKNNGLNIKYEDIYVIAGTQMRVQDIINYINSSLLSKQLKNHLIQIADGYYSKLFMQDCPLNEAIKIIKSADGIPVLAHAFYSYRDYDVIENAQQNVSALIDALYEIGIEGIEVFYPKFSKAQVEWLLKEAKSKNLMITAGSDFHGTPTRKDMMDYKINQMDKTVATLLEINKYSV